MASLTHAESRRLYSWWWDSHISPKNSKWLQENLKDMDTMVKLMIKLLEEDADSFARRAEMYYKKRPELMKLVEEFYRAYRALAERYDHATGALRQAQRTMAEAFPNQIPFAVIDDSPSSSSAAESDPHTPEMSIPVHSFSEPDDLQKDSLSQSANFHGSKRNGAYSEENNALNRNRELKQLNEMFPSGDSTSHPKFAKGKIRKGLNFQQKEDKVPEQKIHDVSRDTQKNGLGNNEGNEKTRSLQDELPTENQNLKTQIKSELDILGKAESEIQRLQESLSRLESEKEAALVQYHKSMEKISNLEMEISHAQAESRKLKSEMLIAFARLEMEKQALEMGVIDLAQYTNQQQQELENNDRMEKLHSESFDKPNTLAVEIQSPVNILRDTEFKTHGLGDDIQQVKDVNSSLKKELQPTEAELGKINVSIQDERLLSAQAEEALQSLLKVHSQSQQEIKLLMFDLHRKVQMLKDMELKRHGLEEEIKQVSKKNENLNDQVLSSTLMINNLQQEVLSLKETQLKFENEVEHHLHDNEALQQDVHYLKEEIATLELKHRCLMEQLEAVGLNKESFQASVKGLQDGNLELKHLCKKHEDVNAILREKLENMERVIEKNTILETSLSDANIQLEELRGKVKASEESSESLNNKISELISENGILVLQLENILTNMEKLSENNDFLGNSLSEANVELERLTGRLKILDESSQSFLNENSNLQSEKNTLVLEVENIAASLENMKRSYAELEEKHLYLEQEKESTLLLVSELQNLLKLEKQQHEAFVMLSNNQLATLTGKLNLLQEEGQNRDEELESVQYILLNSQIEAFMLQKCLTDSKEKNSSLEKRCQEHLEASRLAERFLSQLETENLGQKKIIASISEHNKKLKEAIQMVLNSLGIKSACLSGGTVYEADGQQMLSEIIMMQNFISNIFDENHALLLEESVNITLLQQLGLVLTTQNSEKNALSMQCRTGNEQLLSLKSEKNELLQINEQLRKDILASYLGEENLKAEMETLGKQQLDLIEGHKKLQGENCDLVEQKLLLEKNVLNLRNEIQMLEVENNALIAEVVTLDFLSLILEKFCAERATDLSVCNSDLGSLHDVNNDLEMKVAQMVQKIGVIETENMLLKDTAVKLEDCQDHLLIVRNDLDMARSVHGQLNHQIEQLSHQIETEKNLLIQKDLELTEVKQKLTVVKYENMKLYRDLEAVKVNFDESMYVREELEKSICMLIENNLKKDKEIANIYEAKKMLSSDVNNLSEELAVLRASKEHLSSELTYEIKSYEEEVARLLNDVHISSVHAFILEEKVLELIGECECLGIIAMVQRKMLDEQTIQNNAYLGELLQKLEPLKSESEKSKVQLNAYLPLVLSLQSSTASLEHQILSLVKHHGTNNHLTEDSSLPSLECDKSFQHQSEDVANTKAGVIVGLQKLQVKVETLQKVLVEHGDRYQLANSNANAKSAAMKTDMKVSTPEKPLGEEEAQAKTCTIMELEEKLGETGKHPELQSGGILSSEGTHGPMVEDVQLDHARHNVGSGLYHTGRLKISENDDHMLELWEMTGRDLDNQMREAVSITTEDLDDRETQAVEEDKAQHPSKQAAEKEVDVEKLKVPTNARFSRQDWNKKILECLASDAHRLSILQKSVQELKRLLENSEKSGPSTNMKYDTVKEQLKETEDTISHLFDTNSKLTKKAEDCCVPSDSKTGEEDEVRNQQRRRVSARARRGSEKIGRLELELQRIQYIILRLHEEGENRTRAAHGRSKVRLRDYLYGRRESYRRKKGQFCGCVQPKTGGD